MSARFNRLFAADGRCLDVAVDHGLFGEGPFLTGIEDMAATVAALVEGAPDAIQLAPGQAPLLQRIPGPDKPALVLRVDVANVYGPEVGGPEAAYFDDLLPGAAAAAVRLDAACAPAGMPLMVEPLVMRPGAAGYEIDGDPERMIPLVRQAVELGADVIKADPTDDLDDYPRVIEAAGGRPVLVRGGNRAPDEVILARTETLMARGAAGIVYGRNVIQHERPAAMVRALMAIVHEDAGAVEALALLGARAQ